MHWLSRSIDSRIDTLAEVNVRIVRARDTLAVMHETTWGVELQEINGDRYVLLPAHTPGRPAFTMDGRPLHEALERGSSPFLVGSRSRG